MIEHPISISYEHWWSGSDQDFRSEGRVGSSPGRAAIDFTVGKCMSAKQYKKTK